MVTNTSTTAADLVGRIPARTMSVPDLYQALTDGYDWSFTDPLADSPATRHTPALLHTLREAVFGGMERSTGSAGFTSRLPISAGALDLYETIDQEITEAWAHAFPGQIPNADTPERLLSQVVAVASPDEAVTVMVASQRVTNQGERDEHWHVERTPATFTVAALLRRWVTQIAEFFDPPRTADIDHPCIQCGEMWAWKHEDSEPIPYRVFVFVRDSHGNSVEARCLACKASWGRDMFMWIAAQIGCNLEAAVE